jgi:hypothetical protein
MDKDCITDVSLFICDPQSTPLPSVGSDEACFALMRLMEHPVAQVRQTVQLICAATSEPFTAYEALRCMVQGPGASSASMCEQRNA